MFGLGPANRIDLAAGVIDMRKGFDEPMAMSRATARRAFRDSGRGEVLDRGKRRRFKPATIWSFRRPPAIVSDDFRDSLRQAICLNRWRLNPEVRLTPGSNFSIGPVCYVFFSTSSMLVPKSFNITTAAFLPGAPVTDPPG